MRSHSSSSRPKLLSVCLLALAAAVFAFTYLGRFEAGTHTAAAANSPRLKSLPVSFERNDGQAPPEVRYIARGLGHTTYLTDREAVLVFAAPSRRSKSPAREAGPYPDGAGAPAGEAQVVRLSLVGGNAAPEVSGADRLPGEANYFIGADPRGWRTGVPTFGKVHYEEVYPGIDLTYYGNQGQLEFDLTVAPGADPGLISLAYEGVEGLGIVDGGALSLRTAAGELIQGAPVIYQEAEGGRRIRVEGEYVLRGDRTAGFRVREYDRARPLVIDPIIQYSTLLGGTNGEAAFDVAVDSAGNSYLTGVTRSTDFPVVNPAQAASGGGLRDAFVTKLNPSGSVVLYSTYLGGSGDDQGVDINFGSSGDAYITGWTTSTNFPLAAPFQNSNGGGADAFLTRLGPAGNTLVYSTYAGGSGNDVGSGVATDPAGNIYGIGYTDSPNMQVVNALQPFKGVGVDAYLVKTNPAGDVITYSTYLGGNGADLGNDIVVDSAGNAYGIGDTNSSDLPTVNAFKPFKPSTPDFDAYIAKVSPDGRTLLLGTYAGGASDDSGTAIALDSSNNIYVGGYTGSFEFMTQNAFQPSKRPGFDAFYAKLSPSGSSVIYSSFLGGSSHERVDDLIVDSAGTLFLTGRTESIDFPVFSPVQASNGGLNDTFLTRVGASGDSILYSTYLGGSADDIGWGVGVDSAGNAYVAGQTLSADYPVVNSLQPFRGTSDAFLTKVNPQAAPAPTPTLQFGSAGFTVSEGTGSVEVTVRRFGDAAVPVSVDYSTQNGSALDKGDYTTALGTLSFAPGQATASVIILITDDRFAEGNESFTVTLANPSGASLGAQSTTTVTITDNDAANGPSPVRWDAAFETNFFVRQHYRDFLNREPDGPGFGFWTNDIEQCGNSTPCREVKRVNVSAAFFLSIEFQNTGYLVERVYKVAYGDTTSPNVEGTVPIVRFREYLADSQKIGRGVRVGIDDWEQQLEANKSAYALEFVQRQRFQNTGLMAEQPAAFVDRLNQNAGLVLTQSERDQLVAQLAANNTTAGRASVLRQVAENPALRQREFNRAFVLMQYFGYLRRNPDDAPDSDYRGWRFWLDKLESFGGNYVEAEMIKAFITSDEYRLRFGL